MNIQSGLRSSRALDIGIQHIYLLIRLDTTDVTNSGGAISKRVGNILFCCITVVG